MDGQGYYPCVNTETGETILARWHEAPGQFASALVPGAPFLEFVEPEEVVGPDVVVEG